MAIAPFLQLVSACLGFVGAILFAAGVLRQRNEDITHAADTFWDSNPHVLAMLTAQKAQYLAGAVAVGLSFAAQYVSFVLATPTDAPLTASRSGVLALVIAVPATACVWAIFDRVAGLLAIKYLARVNESVRSRAGGP